MSFMSETLVEEDDNIEVVLNTQDFPSSTEDPPMEEWSSLDIKEFFTAKQELHKQGLYEIPSEERCAQYIPMSKSSILQQVYYNYPRVEDPGIEAALFDIEPQKVYVDDGQELYLDICDEMEQCPIRLFYEGLLKEEIKLNYYCVDPKGVRAMAKALARNTTVQKLDLTESFLTNDSCYHLGEMMMVNIHIKVLDLTACRIGFEGLSILLHGLEHNGHLDLLILSRNRLDDAGGEILAGSIEMGLQVRKINISENNLGSRTAIAMAKALDCYNYLIDLDLSNNKFFSPIGFCRFLDKLAENEYLEKLNLSFNSIAFLRIVQSISNLLKSCFLRVLDLSHNRIKGETVDILVGSLTKAKQLHTLNLSYNPLSLDDAFKVISKMRLNSCKIQRLEMEDVSIDERSLTILARMQRLKSKKDVVVLHGEVTIAQEIPEPDIREIVLNRAEYLVRRSKKPVDVALIFMKLLKDDQTIMDDRAFKAAVRAAGGSMLDGKLLEGIMNVWPGPIVKKAKTINLQKFVDYVCRKWPGRQLPQTPPQSRHVSQDQTEVIVLKKPKKRQLKLSAVKAKSSGIHNKNKRGKK